jgi:uncharacterized protein YkwD
LRAHLSRHVTRACYFACGLLAVLLVAPFGAGFGMPHDARALRPACSDGRCDGARTAGRSFARTLFRLQDAERRRHGLTGLAPNRQLTRAARRHARDMVRRHYFGHFSPANRDVVDRVASTGYNRGRFAAQENLYWWKPRRRPVVVLRAWMASATHRANILNPAWDHFGLATVMRSPFGGGGITVVGVYGTR